MVLVLALSDVVVLPLLMVIAWLIDGSLSFGLLLASVAIRYGDEVAALDS